MGKNNTIKATPDKGNTIFESSGAGENITNQFTGGEVNAGIPVPGQTPDDQLNNGTDADDITLQGLHDKSNAEFLDEHMKPYLVAYPDEIVFFLTSDGQVFLSASESDARNHQRALDHTHELIEYFRG